MPTSTPLIEATFDIGPFAFEQGGRIETMRVGYVSAGDLNAARDNAILLLAETSGHRHSYDALIGPGLAYDTDRFFVVVVDPIGGGASSKPGDGLGRAFPPYTIRDMVRVQHAFVTKGLGLAGLAVVGGSSMGSFQALEWGILYPSFARRLILIVPAARSDNHFAAICDAFEAMITLDPDYGRGGPAEQGIRRAALVYFPWLVSDAHLASLHSAELTAAQRRVGDNWVGRWDADGIMLRYRASRGHDVSKPFDGDLEAALATVKARVLLLHSSSDRIIPAYLTDELRAGLGRPILREIVSDLGHTAGNPAPGTPEYDFLTRAVRQFMPCCE